MMNAKEAVTLLAARGFFVKQIGVEPIFRGGYNIKHEQWGPKIEDQFIAFEEAGFWSVRLSGPGISSTIIRISQHLDDIVHSLFAFFEMRAQATVSSEIIRDLVWWLQREGFWTEITAQGDIEVRAVTRALTSEGATHPDDLMISWIAKPKSDMKVILQLDEAVYSISQVLLDTATKVTDISAGEIPPIIQAVKSIFERNE